MLRRMWECALLSTLVASTAVAENRAWEPIGPEGGNFSALAVDPDDPGTVYAVSHQQVFRRKGARAAWAPAPIPYAAAIAVTSGGRVYAVGNALYRSRDHGERFERLPLPESGATAIAVDPTDAEVIYAGFANTVRRSDDAGRSWSTTDVTIGTWFLFDVFAIAVDPRDPATVYAAVRRGGVYVSHDRGSTWEDLNDGLPCPSQGETPCIAAFARVPSGELLVGIQDGGLMRSDDDGASWSDVPLGVGADVVVGMAAGGASTVFAGVSGDPGYGSPLSPGFALLCSFDGGESWDKELDYPEWLRAPSAFGLDPDSGDLLYVGTGDGPYVFGGGNGLFRVTRGQGSRLDQEGLYGLCPHHLVAAATASTTLLAGIDREGSVTASDVAEGTWSYPPVDGTYASALASDPNDAQRAYAVLLGRTLLSSDDAGVSWAEREIEPNRYNRYIEDLAVDARDSSTLYATAQVNDGGWTRVVQRSHDMGRSWETALEETATSGGARAIAVDEASGDIYAVFDFLIARSRDGGDNWESVSVARSQDQYWWDLSVAPTAPATLLRIGNGGLEISADGGSTWRAPAIPAEYGNRYIYAVAVDPSDARTLYAAAYADFDTQQLFRSDDGGETWSASGAALPSFVMRLAVDPHDGRVVYAATCGSSVQQLTQAPAAAGGGDGCRIAAPAFSAPMWLLHGLAIGLLGWWRARG